MNKAFDWWSDLSDEEKRQNSKIKESPENGPFVPSIARLSLEFPEVNMDRIVAFAVASAYVKSNAPIRLASAVTYQSWDDYFPLLSEARLRRLLDSSQSDFIRHIVRAVRLSGRHLDVNNLAKLCFYWETESHTFSDEYYQTCYRDDKVCIKPLSERNFQIEESDS